MKKLFKNIILLCIGGLLYICLELAFRGRTHISMFFVGGFCSFNIGLINEVIPWKMPILFQSLIGSVIVTITELFSGIFLNILLGLNVWDYSNLPFNFLGQICLLFWLLWVIASCVWIICDDYLRYWLFNEEKPKYRLF